MDKERTCSECSITKPLTEFHKKRDDFTKRCRECVNKAERLRYKLKGVESGAYQCYEVDLDEIHDELSFPELKALMYQHNIPIKAHSTKVELVEALKLHDILPENYVSGLRRAVSPPTKSKRLSAKSVELTDMSNGSVIIFPSIYKTAKFLGTYNHNITKHNGFTYTTSNDKTYKIKIL